MLSFKDGEIRGEYSRDLISAFHLQCFGLWHVSDIQSDAQLWSQHLFAVIDSLRYPRLASDSLCSGDWPWNS